MKFSFDKDLYVKLFKKGCTKKELADVFNVSPRTTERWEHELRKDGLIDKRSTVTGRQEDRHNYEDIFKEVEIYLEHTKKVWSNYQDLYDATPFKGTWSKHKQVEDAVALLSDMHTGMVNKAPITGEITYDEKIQEKSLQNLYDGYQRFYHLYKPSYKVETFYIFGLGDLITNDRIFEGQKSEITCCVGRQIEKTLFYVSDLIRHLLEMYPRVVYINMVGNHGRTTSKPIAEDVESNFEFLLGLLLKERFANNHRVEVVLPNDYAFTYKIRGHKYLLTHGNSIRGATLNSIEKAAKEISLLVEKDSYDVITIGHFHSCYELPITPTTTMLVNGCFIYKDSFAYYKLRKFSTARQYYFMVSKRSAMHNLQKLDLMWR